MNEMSFTGPCADYEHDLVDLREGSLGPERARVIRLHVESCPRCRAWQAEFAAFDAGLAAALPSPALPADFERRLQARISALAQPANRSDLRARAAREHERLVEALLRGARRHALLDGIGSAAVAICVLALARGLLEQTDAMQLLFEGPQRLVILGGIGTAVALAALAWTAVRRRLPLVG
jgi:anti-sigma factor RsiW